MIPLTDRQREILEFIALRIGEGLPPTLAEIAAAFGFNQPRAAYKHLQALQAKGCIELLPGRNRGIRLLDPSARGAGLPLVGRVAAGAPILAIEHVERRVTVDPALFKPRADYLLRVKGDSMRDAGILDGDLAAVHRTREAHNGRIVVARIEDEVTLKRLRVLASKLRLEPANPDYAPIEIDPRRTPFAIEGVYVGVIRTA
ncbi:MAG TPA: transcriptional repressor LexA [Rhodanobacteraceae bacterium]|jgi:repressor LexA|nr:transcriptional repressor LexA [Rhodanobacteraceae bacterium]